jgi:glycosyltransferase involved in cell wall biosynthesis
MLNDDPLSTRAEAVSLEFKQRAQQLILTHARRVLPMSQSEGNLLHEDFGVPDSKQCVTYLGVDPIFSQVPDTAFSSIFPARDFVLCVARICISKNQLGLVRSWRNETTPLVLIGQPEDQAYLEQCRRAAGDNVKILPPLSTPQIVAAYRAAKVHVLASWWEEVGLSALEAAVCGCNLVMTQNGPAREYFHDPVWMCDPADESSIRAAIKDALAAPRSPEWSEWVRETYTWERCAAAHRDAYRAVLAENVAPAKYDINECELEELAITLGELLTLKENHAHDVTERLYAGSQWARELEAQIRARDRELAWMNRPAMWLRRVR